MKMRVVGIACGEFGIGHMNALIALALGQFRMKHGFPLHGYSLLAESTEGFQIKTQFVLLKSLPALGHDRPANPIPQRITYSVGAGLILLRTVDDAVSLQANVVHRDERISEKLDFGSDGIHTCRVIGTPIHIKLFYRFHLYHGGIRDLQLRLSAHSMGRAYPHESTENQW